MGTNTRFEAYKDILVKMEIIELPETLKVAGMTSENHPNFQNIDVYHEKYKHLVAGRHSPYIEIGLASDIVPQGWYVFGCQVDATDDIPTDLVGIDTGLTKFACLTFRMQPGISSEELVGGEEGGGPGMELASEYLAKVWISKNSDKLIGYSTNEHGYSFTINKADAKYAVANIMLDGSKTAYTIFGGIEVYKTDIET